MATASEAAGPAVQHALGIDWWTYLREHPTEAAIFDAAMGDVAREYPADALRACELADVTTLVDVGGGSGHLLAEVLPEYPVLHALLLDQPYVLAGAHAVLGAAGVQDRVRLIPGDFFVDVPSGGDLYVLSMITHDWADKDVARLLSTVRHAMPASARLALLDAVLPEGDTPHRGKLIDVVMMTLHPGRERTATDFAALLDQCGFRLLDIRRSATPVAAVIATPTPVSAIGRSYPTRPVMRRPL